MKFTDRFNEIRKEYSLFHEALENKVKEIIERTTHKEAYVHIGHYEILDDDIYVSFVDSLTCTKRAYYISNDEFDEFMSSYEASVNLNYPAGNSDC